MSKLKYQPEEITEPPSRTIELLPPYDEIPDKFKYDEGRNKWIRLFNDWYSSGTDHLIIKPEKGIEVKKALEHINAAMNNHSIMFMHRRAGCAYLMSLWFKDATWEIGIQRYT